MKIITSTFIYLQIAALCLATTFADSKQKEKHFSGPVVSSETATFEGTTMFVDGSGRGRSQHLGRFTYTFEFVVDLTTGIGVGSAEFTAANGDTFRTESTGLGGPVAELPGVNRVVEQHTIVGGTGRFAGAQGTFTLDRLIKLSTGQSVGTVDGSFSQ